MGHLEGNFTPVPYIGRKVPKGQYRHQLRGQFEIYIFGVIKCVVIKMF
jgi:hypothetical protein